MHWHPYFNLAAPLFKDYNITVNLQASSPGCSGGRVGKGKRAFNYISGLSIIYIKKVIAKCWLAEKTLVMTSLPLTWHMFFNVSFHFRLFPLHADWQKSDSSVNGEPQGNWRWNSNSRDVIASSPSFSHPAARGPWSACLQAKLNLHVQTTACKQPPPVSDH